MNYESMWNELKTYFSTAHAGFDEEGNHMGVGLIKIILNEMNRIEGYEKFKSEMK
jgi:hypothetical protein